MADNTQRLQYWTEKYRSPEWGEDMHFALDYDSVSVNDFAAGLSANTLRVTGEILQLASVYRLAKGIRVLDFGCGTGDLLLRLAEIVENVQGTGIDLSPTAVEIARKRVIHRAVQVTNALTFLSGDVTALEALTNGGGQFDLIICRDMYYLLDNDEQARTTSAFRRLLAPGGLLYIADLSVEHESVPLIHKALIERQHGGVPITWRDVGGTMVHSIVQEVKRDGFVVVRGPMLEENAVADSYRKAAAIASPDTAAKYEELARVAATKIRGRAQVPYVRCFFRLQAANHERVEEIGINVLSDVKFGRKTVLRQGEWKLPKGKWSLIIGRSGAGKTTFLNLLSGYTKMRGVQRVLPSSTSLFLLPQEPVLIDELRVVDNIRLYARDSKVVSATLQALGLGGEVVERKANDGLSGGERHRVALGQAIVAEPQLLLLDEPTTGVDIPRRKQFFCDLRCAFRDRDVTVVCVDHDFESIERYFDAVFEILDGELVTMRLGVENHE